MVAHLVRDPFDRLKWDGFRAIVETEGDGNVRLYSRKKNDFNKRFQADCRMEGIELITLLKKSNPNLPIMALSGSIDGLVLARKLGVRHTIAKPCNRSTVLQSVESALAKKARLGA